VSLGKRKRWGAGAVLGGIAVAVLALSAWAGVAVVRHAHSASTAAAGIQVPPAAGIRAVAAVRRPRAVYATAASVPVLVYHEMGNGCAATALTCKSSDTETVSAAQFRSEMSYLLAAGYRTISLGQYEAWLRDPRTLLPRRPVLLTADNGIGNFLEGAQPVLERDGFTMTAFLVSGFADGAAGSCEPGLAVAGLRYGVQPGCGAANKGWDLTWAQLKALSPRAWSFALEAGPSGHFVQDYDRGCRVFDACEIPGETTAAYEARVRRDITAGLREMGSRLPGRVNRDAWVVPYSDLGYHRCAQPDCTPQPSTGPAGWLARYAASRFAAVFVEDAFRNAFRGERFRMDINGSYTAHDFANLLTSFTAAGDFARTRRPSRTVLPSVPSASAAPLAPAVPLAASTPAATALACHPLTSGGKCYEPGEFCPAADHGARGVAGDGKAITCRDNGGWRWEPTVAPPKPSPSPRPPPRPSPTPSPSPSTSPTGG
jgi:hypothetical protein